MERAILEGDAETGVCLMAVEAGLDTGPVYAEEATTIGDEETAEELRARLVAIGLPDARASTWPGARRAPAAPGPGRHPVLRREDPARRAGAPLGATGRPAATGGPAGPGLDHLPGQAPRVSRRPGRARRGRPGTTGRPPGSLDGTDVAAGEGPGSGWSRVQPEGKRPMDATDWLRGVRPATGRAPGPMSRIGPAGRLRRCRPPAPRPELRVAPSILSADFGSLADGGRRGVARAPTGSTSTSWTATSCPT